MNTRPPQTKLEVIVHSPQRKTSSTPLLFVHGAFTSAWCWEERYLPFFAAAGFEAHAVSLSGHGDSRGCEHLDSLSINDYVNDVREVAEAMPVAPVLIGHSMGGFVVQKYLEQHVAPGAVLMCSVPPQGFMSAAVDMMLMRPNLLVELNKVMTGSRDSMASLRDAMFAQPIALDDMKRIYRHAQPESHRALWDMTLLNIPNPSKVRMNLTSSVASKHSYPLPREGGKGDGTSPMPAEGATLPLLVLGAALDQLMPPSSIEMTARAYGVEAEIFPAMGHGLMLEQDWQKPADRILAWLAERGLAGKKGKH